MRALSTPSADDEHEFHSNMPVSELTERDTRAIEASVVSSAPPVAETEDGVTHETWPIPIESQGARGMNRPILDRETEVRRPPTKVPRPPRIKQIQGRKRS